MSESPARQDHGHIPEASDPARWVDQYGDVLFRYAVLRVKDHSVAEDLVQETFLAALRAQGQFAGQSTERTWFIGILRRKIVDHIRKAVRSRSVPQDRLVERTGLEIFDHRGHWRTTLAKWPSDPAELLEDQEFWDVFQQCLSKLPSILSDSFCLREMAGLDAPEICKVLKISKSNLAVRIHRARLLLRQCLELNWFARG